MKTGFLARNISALIVFVYFALQLYNVHLFSQSFEVLSLRNIDDAAMQAAISEWHRAIFEGRIPQIFFKFDYAYGWIFWFIYGMASLPAATIMHLYPKEFALETFVIQSNRFTTVCIAIIFIYSLRQVLKQLSLRYVPMQVSTDLVKNYINYATVLTLLSPAFGYWIGRVQPNILVVASFTLSVFFLIKSKAISDRNMIVDRYLTISVFYLSISFASKAVTLYWFPLYVTALYFLHKNLFKSKGILYFFRKTLPYLFLLTILTLVFVSPSFVLHPIKTLRNVFEIFLYFANTTTEKYFDIYEISNRWRFGFIDQIIGFLPFVLICLSILIPIFFRQRINRVSLFIFSYLCIIGLIFSIFGPSHKGLIASYTFPAILFLAMSGVFSLQFLNRFYIRIVFACLIGFLTAFNFYQNLDNSSGERREAVNTYIIDSQSKQTILKTSEIEILQEIIELDKNPLIVQSFLSPTPYSSMYTNTSVLFVFHNWKTVMNTRNIDWIVLPKSEYLSDEFFRSMNDEAFEFPDRSCNKIRETGVSIIFKCVAL